MRGGSRRRPILVLLVLTSVMLISLDGGGGGNGGINTVRRFFHDAFAPVQEALGKAVSPVGDLFDRLGGSKPLENENKRLKRELADARGELAASKGLKRDVAELRKLMDLPFVQDIDTIAARVISLGPGNFESTVVLDKGAKAGITEGMPVVTGDGLVGRVTEVSQFRSTVLLITDAGSAVGVRFATSGEAGIAQGRGRQGVLDLDLIDSTENVTKGETVVTSGLELGRFPQGIPVAVVTRAKATPGKLEQEVSIRPLVDTRRLEIVKVLRWQGRSMEPTTKATPAKKNAD